MNQNYRTNNRRTNRKYKSYKYSLVARHQNNIIFAAFTMILVIACAIMINGFGSQSEASKGQGYGKYYMSYEVQSGDSLWNIAQTYTENCNQEIASYIEEVVASNNLNDTNIQSGTYLIIPYYMEAGI